MANVIADALEGFKDEALRLAVIEELKRGAHQECVASMAQQKRIGIENHSQTYKSIEGAGRLRMRVDPTHFHFWGQKVGYGCWRDKTFLNDVEKWNPELKLKCGGTRLQVGFGTPSGHTTKKFTKTYQ